MNMRIQLVIYSCCDLVTEAYVTADGSVLVEETPVIVSHRKHFTDEKLDMMSMLVSCFIHDTSEVNPVNDALPVLGQYKVRSANDTESRFRAFMSVSRHKHLRPWLEAADRAAVHFVKDGNKPGTLCCFYQLCVLADKYRFNVDQLDTIMERAVVEHLSAVRLAEVCKEVSDGEAATA